jgi:hypothetical protein
VKKFIALFLFVSLYATAQTVELPDRKITVDQARELVMASLSAEQRRLPSLQSEHNDEPKSSRFSYFTVIWEGEPNGSVVVGNYAVDIYSGDVWSAVIGCHEEKSNRLQTLQKQIRATLHLSQSEYQRLKTKGPLCEE